MKLHVLGSYGPFPLPGKATSGYLLDTGSAKIVLDMGAGTLSRLLRFTDPGEIDAIWISHLHFDHTSDLLPFRYLLDSLGKTVTVITQKEDSDYYRVLFGSDRFNVVNVDAGSEVTVKDCVLTFYEMKHPARDLAVRIEGEKTFVYTGDTVMCPAVTEAVKGADAALCDCSQNRDFKGPHMTVTDAKELYELTKVKIFATHFSPAFDPSEEFKDHPGIIPVKESETYEI